MILRLPYSYSCLIIFPYHCTAWQPRKIAEDIDNVPYMPLQTPWETLVLPVYAKTEAGKQLQLRQYQLPSCDADQPVFAELLSTAIVEVLTLATTKRRKPMPAAKVPTSSATRATCTPSTAFQAATAAIAGVPAAGLSASEPEGHSPAEATTVLAHVAAAPAPMEPSTLQCKRCHVALVLEQPLPAVCVYACTRERLRLWSCTSVASAEAPQQKLVSRPSVSAAQDAALLKALDYAQPPLLVVTAPGHPLVAMIRQDDVLVARLPRAPTGNVACPWILLARLPTPGGAFVSAEHHSGTLIPARPLCLFTTIAEQSDRCWCVAAGYNDDMLAVCRIQPGKSFCGP